MSAVDVKKQYTYLHVYRMKSSIMLTLHLEEYNQEQSEFLEVSYLQETEMSLNWHFQNAILNEIFEGKKAIVCGIMPTSVDKLTL